MTGASAIARVLRRTDTADPNQCWIWQGSTSAEGYGVVRLPNCRRVAYTHRVVYEALVGPLNAGLQIDHLCHSWAVESGTCPGGPGCCHRRCVNPAHLEAVDCRRNVLRSNGPSAVNARKTHCPQGHPYSGEHLRVKATGHRVCRTCENFRRRKPIDPQASNQAAAHLSLTQLDATQECQ